MFYRFILIFCSFFLFCMSVFAVTLSPEQDSRASHLFEQVKCPVCHGQSLAESDVEIAVGLKTLIKERIAQGQSDEEIFEHLTTIYGDDILFSPPHKQDTFLLWYGPYLLMILGAGLFLLKKLKRKKL